MNLMERFYHEVANATSSLKENEQFSLLFQRERLPEILWSEDKILRERGEAWIANVMCEGQLCSETQMFTLPQLYCCTLENLVPFYWNEKNFGKVSTPYASLLEEVKWKANQSKKIHPDGSRYYPVKLHPSDWRDSLQSGFSNIDLLDSSEMYMSEYMALTKRMDKLLKLIFRYTVDEQESELWQQIQTLRSQLLNQNAYVGMFKKLKKVPEYTWQKLYVLLECHSVEESNAVREDMVKKDTPLRTLEKLCVEFFGTWQAKTNYLKQYREELLEVLQKRKVIRTRLELSMCRDIASNQTTDAVLPHTIDQRYEELIVAGSYDDLLEKTTLSTDNADILKPLCCLFAGYIPRGVQEELLAGHLQIMIGGLIRRIDIERDWLRKDVLQSQYFRNIGETYIPAYPTSLVVMKDITVKFVFDEVSVSQAEKFVRHIRQNKTFLCFGERYQDKQIKYAMSTDTLWCRYDWPMILGYYLKFIHT